MHNDCLTGSKGQLKPDYLSAHSHSAVSCINLHKSLPIFNSGNPVMAAKEFFRTFPYQVSYPLPVLPPTKISTAELNGLDPSLDLVRQKKKWENHKSLLLKSCKHIPRKTQKSLESPSLLNEDEAEIPWNVTMLAHHLKLDPDKEFTGVYNWYYGGGNMETISIAEKKFLIRPGSIADGVIYLTALEVKGGQWTPTLVDSFAIQVQESQPVYQIDASGSDFLVRQPNMCLYMEATESGDLIVSSPYAASSDFPLVSASLNNIKPGEFCTLATDRSLKVYQVARQRCLVHGVLPINGSLCDKWGSIHYIDAHTLFHADRNQVGIIDLRERADFLVKKWDKVGELCDDICCTGQGACSYQYVATTHHLFGLDLRQGFTQRWTHSLPHCPTVVKVLSRIDMVDTIFIGSQRSDAVIAIENRWDEGETPTSRSHPKALPSLRETLHLSRSQGHSLSHTQTARFTLCLTGICCIEDENINLLRCSSIGDVFWQRLYNCSDTSNIELTKDDYALLDQWQQKCELLLKFSEAKVNATKIETAANLQQKILDPAYEDDADVVTPDKSDVPPNWKSSKKKLLKYCDYLAPKLLEAWELDEEAEWDHGEASPNPSEVDISSDEEDFNDKVKGWIEAYSSDMKRNNEYNVESSVDEDEEGAVGYDSSQLMASPPLPPPSSHSDSSSQCPVHSKPSPTKKRKNFVSGF